jgi:hypothetical protein
MLLDKCWPVCGGCMEGVEECFLYSVIRSVNGNIGGLELVRKGRGSEVRY